jgi:hypothetical protein
MQKESEIRKRLSALQGTKALLKGSDLSRVEAGIRTLEWVLGEKE